MKSFLIFKYFFILYIVRLFFDIPFIIRHNKAMDKQPTVNKVLVFSLTYFPFVGGAEVALREIISRLIFIDFDLITARFDKNLPQREQINNLTIYRVGHGNRLDKYFYPLRAFLLAKKLHQQNHYHLIWSMMATWAGMPALWFKLKFSQVKYLLTLQSGDSDLFIWLRTWFWHPFYKMIYSRADHIQVISRWLAKRARKYGYQGKISIIPNGVDLNKFKPIENLSSKKLLRQKLNLSVQNKIIFTSSRLVKKNNLALLIQATKLLIDYYQLPIVLLIAGTGQLEGRLKRLVKKLKLNSRVIFLGQLTEEELIPYYQCADVFARPSLSEGQGVSFLEAMACGLPVVATPVGGIVDFLTHKQTGLYCQLDPPHDLAEKINLILTEQKLADRLREKALSLVKANYTWPNISQVLGKLLSGNF